MDTVSTTRVRQSFVQSAAVALPPLESGDHLSQKEFHSRYEMMPEDATAELIGGIVYMQSALKRSHGRFHNLLMHWMGSYENYTWGVEAYDNTTTIMGDKSEPQPDGCLIISPERGGQMRFTEDDYLQGAPELIGEIASSSESIDMHGKKRDYELAGVKEYVVVALRAKKIHWFVNRGGAFIEVSCHGDGCYHSEAFPGLWLDTVAFLTLDRQQLLTALGVGLATEEHAQFVAKLRDHQSK